MGIAATNLAAAQTIQISRENKTIAISTKDEATATADIASITIGFEIFGPDALSVSTEGGKLSHAIVDALHKAGIEDKAIESSAQGVERNTEFSDKDSPEQRAKRQFVLNQSWEVSVLPQSAADVIRMAIAAGANKSGAIEWRLSDRKALQAKAAGNALAKAREVAAKMAEGLNVKLGALIYASNETPDAFHIFAPHPLAGGGGAVFSPEVMPPPPPPPPSLEIRPQTIREEATVYAVFAIE
ncbi:MAG: SIMPL domain-containing protein [Terracidiphilus sp.]